MRSGPSKREGERGGGRAGRRRNVIWRRISVGKFVSVVDLLWFLIAGCWIGMAWGSAYLGGGDGCVESFLGLWGSGLFDIFLWWKESARRSVSIVVVLVWRSGRGRLCSIPFPAGVLLGARVR